MGSKAMNAADKNELRKSIPGLYLSFSGLGKMALSVLLDQTLRSGRLPIFWSIVSVRKVYVPGGPDLQVSQESVAVSRGV